MNPDLEAVAIAIAAAYIKKDDRGPLKGFAEAFLPEAKAALEADPVRQEVMRVISFLSAWADGVDHEEARIGFDELLARLKAQTDCDDPATRGAGRQARDH